MALTLDGLQECLTGHSEAALEVVRPSLIAAGHTVKQRFVLVFRWLPLSSFYLPWYLSTWDVVIHIPRTLRFLSEHLGNTLLLIPNLETLVM